MSIVKRADKNSKLYCPQRPASYSFYPNNIQSFNGIDVFNLYVRFLKRGWCLAKINGRKSIYNKWGIIFDLPKTSRTDLDGNINICDEILLKYGLFNKRILSIRLMMARWV